MPSDTKSSSPSGTVAGEQRSSADNQEKANEFERTETFACSRTSCCGLRSASEQQCLTNAASHEPPDTAELATQNTQNKQNDKN